MIEVAISPVHLGDTDLKICLTNSGPHEYLNVIFVIRLPGWHHAASRTGKDRPHPASSRENSLREAPGPRRKARTLSADEP